LNVVSVHVDIGDKEEFCFFKDLDLARLVVETIAFVNAQITISVR
jgi:hypothetical protein